MICCAAFFTQCVLTFLCEITFFHNVSSARLCTIPCRLLQGPLKNKFLAISSCGFKHCFFLQQQRTLLHPRKGLGPARNWDFPAELWWLFELTSLPAALWPTSTSRPLFWAMYSAVTFTEWLGCGCPLLFIEHLSSQGLGELVLKAPSVQEGLLVILLNSVLYPGTEVYTASANQRPVWAC